MTRLLSLALLLSAASFVLPACSESIAGPSSSRESSAGSSSAATASGLTGTVWKLQSFQRSDATSVRVPDPNQFTVEFAADGKMAVRADCNRCAGSYSQSGTALDINQAVACTRAACPSAPFDQEYLAALVDTTSARLTGDVLECASARGVLTFGR
jgi:heat shock protein HslJ